MRILLAFDSFKGSLASHEVAAAFAEGLVSCCPEWQITTLPVADGGEGSLEAVMPHLHGVWREVEVCDPLGRPVSARYGTIRSGEGALIELAAASGLPRLQPEERNPLLTSTRGTGELIAHALRSGCREIFLFLGGSATNDGGTGLLRALGYRFLDETGRELPEGGGSLVRLASIDEQERMGALNDATFHLICDVENPLYGPTGAAAVYGPQKGADPTMVELLDRGLARLSEVVLLHNGFSLDNLAGSGAAGGVAGGVAALLGGHIERGIDFILRQIDFDNLLKGYDLVITGEGRIDHQTLHGKAPQGILQAALRHQIPTIAFGGSVEPCPELASSGFREIRSIYPTPLPLEEAMNPHRTREALRHAAAHLARELCSCERLLLP